MTEGLTTLKQHRCFGGVQGVDRNALRHGLRVLRAAAGYPNHGCPIQSWYSQPQISIAGGPSPVSRR
jgi:hypothetical protein